MLKWKKQDKFVAPNKFNKVNVRTLALIIKILSFFALKYFHL